MAHTLARVVGLALLALFTGCASYVTPGGPADFRALGITPDEQADLADFEMASELKRRPAASFPAGVAVVRVQDAAYRSYSHRNGWDTGRFTVIAERDAEDEIDMQRVAGLPLLRGVTRLNRLVLDPRASTEEDFRRAAARVQADMLLLYTFDTRFDVDDTVPFLDKISLGILPNKEAEVTAIVSAALMDTRTGYIYALAEASDTQKQTANAWTSGDAVDQSRLRAEKQAFSKLVDTLSESWTSVVRAYAPAEATAASVGG